MGIADSLKFLDKSRAIGSSDALQKATGDAAAPAVPDFKSLASMGGGRAPAPHPVSLGQHMGSESVPVNEFRMGYQPMMEPPRPFAQEMHIPAREALIPEPPPSQLSAGSKVGIQPMGLSQDELRAIAEGREAPPARAIVMPANSESQGQGSAPPPPDYAVTGSVMPSMFAPLPAHAMMPQGITLSHISGQPGLFSSRRYTLADRARMGDHSAMAHLGHPLEAPAQDPEEAKKAAEAAQKAAEQAAIDREGELIRSIFPQYQPGMMGNDFLRTPLIPNTETCVEEARPLFGPLPASDKEFIVGRMDFESMPTWTDSLVQYLKMDPTYFADKEKARQMEEADKAEKANQDKAGDGLHNVSRSPKQIGVPSVDAPAPSSPQKFASPSGPSPQKDASPKPPGSPPKASFQAAAQASPKPAWTAPKPTTTPKAAPFKPPVSAPAGDKPAPPKRKTGGIADRLAAFQKAVEESQ